MKIISKKISLLFVMILVGIFAQAQELNCTINILTPNIQISDRSQIDNLKTSIREFMNNTRWGNDNYIGVERIECNILLTITSINNNEFSGTLQIIATRPVYGTTYTSPLCNILDKAFTFSYQAFQQLEYRKGTYVNDLTSIMSYYAYIVLGYDGDSYSELGGSSYFAAANEIVQSAQTSTISGWKANDKPDKNRYKLIFEITDERMVDLRKSIYNYYRKGFDQMHTDLEASRAEVGKSIEALKPLYKFNVNSYALQIFFQTKRDELISLYKDAPSSEKQTVSNLLKEMDVNNFQKYDTQLK